MSLHTWGELRRAVCYGDPDKLIKAVWGLEWAYNYSLEADDTRSANREMAISILAFLDAVGVRV